MNSAPNCKFTPVLRCPRHKWCIPIIWASQNLVLGPAAALGDVWEGTTPQGREIFRKILVQTSTLAQQNNDTRHVIAAVEKLLERFPEMNSEFLLIFFRLCGQSDPTEQVSLRDLATLMVLRIHLEQARRSDSACQQ